MHRQIFLTWLLCRWSVRGIEPLLVDSNNGKLPKASQSHRNTAKSDRNQQPQSPPIGSSSLKQKLDHFNSNDRREWLQYYMHRKSPYQSPDGAVFLVVSGEDEADRNWLANERLPHVELADRINASIFLLEHRFYGTSRPTNDTSIENLKYLNARQATKDIDGFVKEVNRREKLTNPKWITFGGSYSGSLAAWAREKHPRTIRAAVASSAPLQAKLNFKEFEGEIEKIIGRKNPKCVTVMRKLFRKMSQMSKTLEGRRKLVKIFRLDNSLIRPTVTSNDIANFFLVITNYIGFIIMHSGINVKNHRDVLTVDVMCDKLINSPTLESVRMLIGMVMGSQGKPSQATIDISYDNFLEFMRDEQWDAQNARPRAWLYQNCYEFGHFRTSEKTDGLFAGTLPLSFFLTRCTDLFGDHFSLGDMEKRIAETNEYFGGNEHFQATDVVLSNGSDDPWTLLGVKNDTKATGNYVVHIEGASHVADFYPSSNSDPNTLRIARQMTVKMIEDVL